MRNLFQVFTALFSLFVATAQAAAADAGPYSYYFKGELVTMTPSLRYVAARQPAGGYSPDLSALGLAEALDIPQDGLKAKGYVIYSRPQTKDKSASAVDLTPQALSGAGISEAQPVFEQGWAIMIPTDRVIVGLTAAEDLSAATAFLTGTGFGVRQVLPHRKNTFIAVIDNPGNGRVYEVARKLSSLPGVSFAEPDHLMVMDRSLKPSEAAPKEPFSLAALAADNAGRAPVQTETPTATPGWTVIASMDAETTNVPYGTQVGVGASATTYATWGRTNYRARSGSYSYYCAGSAVTAPGPAPTGMAAYFYFPVNLAAYEEVYLEFWFYAKNEVGGDGTPYDYGKVLVIDGDTLSAVVTRYLLHNGPEGDMTIDPTTANGWRRCLIRIPPAARKANIYLDFEFDSDSSDSREGLYLDDIRVVGTSDVDTEPLGSDPFAGRQYELRNVGQVAGLGATSNDMDVPQAWADTPGPYTPLVAVIDDGVDLTHPDLNLVQGYDWNGSTGGGPKNDTSNHGTACAGNVGARANSIGVRGTAPGVPIMPVEGLGSATQQSDLASAIDVAVAHGAKVLSNSWGWVGTPVQVIVNAISDALQAGRVVVFAAGNGPDRPPYTYDVAFPGNQTGSLDIITVGASSMTDEHKAAASSDGLFNWGSSYVGSGPDVVAPGPWSYTTDRQGSLGYNNGSELADANYTVSFGGTSSSTPKVAGICALMLKANPKLTPAQVKNILCSTAKDIGAVGYDDKTGWGRVNALAAVVKAKDPGGGSVGTPGAMQLLILQ